MLHIFSDSSDCM